jgi:nucleoside-diphosphate-sugar epimerase
VLEPAVTGTKNVLKASLEAKVKRVIVVSSGTSVYMRPDWSRGQVLDESCWSDEQYCKSIGVAFSFSLCFSSFEFFSKLKTISLQYRQIE